MSFSERLVAAWYAPRATALSVALLPLAGLYRAVIALRRALYRAGILSTTRLPVPVIVVGNLAAGGTGKTPLVRALAEALAARGVRVGIVSRGHGGANATPREVRADDDPRAAGDEPPLLAATGLPVFIGRDRVAAARALLAAYPDRAAIIADDGLQHYALGRDVEIAVVDGARGFGNGWLLPAGPLREPVGRLAAVDHIVRLVAAEAGGAVSGGPRESTMTYEPLPWVNLHDPRLRADPRGWTAGPVHAVAGIGNPGRFFDQVRALGIAAVEHAFPDHYRYSPGDLAWTGASAILMTEKDAVKCRSFADARYWVLPIRARLDPALVERVLAQIGAA